MLKKLLLVVLAISIFYQISNAQEARCYATDFTRELLTNDPYFAHARAIAQEHMERWMANNPDGGTRAVLTVPVVVHVVYNTTQQNISDAQIQSQIDVLNEDYRKLNADAANVPSVWTSLVADSEIEFRLAVRDPEGWPTTGITRTLTTVTSFDGDAVKRDNQGGKSPWPASHYLNIWVCNLSSGLLGYAYPPGVSAALDGVVIGYRYFGRVGTLSPVYNKGRTTTHEIAHYLNLEHLWGVNNSNTNCTNDDGVSDTPKQDSENFGCPQFPQVSCNNGPNGDMFMNYMDYVNDACMFFFTNGQTTRMRAALQGPRASLLTSNALSQPVASVGEQELLPFKFYPNPTNRFVAINLALSNAVGANVYVRDLTGRVVFESTINGNGSEIDLSSVQTGVYSIEVGQNRMYSAQRLIVQH